MKHDEEWISNYLRYQSWPTFGIEERISMTAQAYAEHLNRWRVTENELPEYGQLVDIIWSGRRRMDYKLIKNEDGDYFRGSDGISFAATVASHWKPVDLPEIE